MTSACTYLLDVDNDNIVNLGVLVLVESAVAGVDFFRHDEYLVCAVIRRMYCLTRLAREEKGGDGKVFQMSVQSEKKNFLSESGKGLSNYNFKFKQEIKYM